MLQRQHTLQVLDGEEDEYGVPVKNSVALGEDLFTNALVTGVDFPPSIKLGRYTKPIERIGALSSMFAVTVIQVLMAWTVYLHIKNDMIKSNIRPMQTAYEMIVGSNITVPLGTATALCGEWEDQEMQDDIALGPLRTMNMPDGTVFAPNADYSLFYNLKQPTRSWDYGKLGSDRSVMDDLMYVISEGVSINPFTPSGYSLLFILTLMIFLFSVFVELRHISRALSMVHHLPSPNPDGKTITLDSDGKISIIAFTPGARAQGAFIMSCRLFSTIVVMLLGVDFLFHTTVKMDLIMNGLALMFIMELDEIVFQATTPNKRKKQIAEMEPIQFPWPDGWKGKFARISSVALPVLTYPLVIGLALVIRFAQVIKFQKYFRIASAICLFAGPTPGGRRHRLETVGPVAGFCDSLLGITCAPSVTPAQAAQQHGYCVVTDQTTLKRPTIQMYLDDPTLYAYRYDQNGKMKSWITWGEANPALFKTHHWMNGPYQELLRKNCLQMYQNVPPDDLEVDDDVGETMDGAPFACARAEIFPAVFGGVVQAFDEGKSTIEAIEKVRDLRHPAVVKAIDGCRNKPFQSSGPTGVSNFWSNASIPLPTRPHRHHRLQKARTMDHHHKHRVHNHIHREVGHVGVTHLRGGGST
jgi:hypothetical protein